MTSTRLLLLAVVSAGVLLGFVQALNWASSYYQSRALDAARSTLLLVEEAVDQAIGRFAPIPELIAGDPAVRQLLTQNDTGGDATPLNAKLQEIALSVEASEIYVMDRSGLTVATSNFRDADSFLGQNFSFRPYFQRSLAGRVSVFHALGTTSGERGFFFSAPVLDGARVIGVLTVKITVGEIEEDWQDTGHEILIADGNGIVFLTSRPAFKYRALAPLSAAVREALAETQQYPLDRVVPLGLSSEVIGHEMVRVTIPTDTGDEKFITASQPLDLVGWHAIAFTPLQPINAQVFRTMALGGLALTAMLLAGFIVQQRRANILQRMRSEQEQRALLEERVRERTADLDAANARLLEEVVERRHAEERLRKSQKELVQAGKLAALGQMSAAISHEINQPLAAIKSYADNAAEFLARKRVEDAKSNIMSISEMSDRMAEISHQLRNFARRPSDTLKPINVPEVISETISLVGPQIRAQNAEVRFHPPQTGIWALGGSLRLQQVLVNILTNALEAMKDQTAPVIEIDLSASEGLVAIAVRDHGPGVPTEALDQVFDAFYTTKEAGAGMGLGMSISQNIINDFGGSLTAETHPEGGAVFTVILQHDDTGAATGIAS